MTHSTIAPTADITPITGRVTSAADQLAYVRLLGEQRRWIEGELGLCLADLQPAAMQEYAETFSVYQATGTIALLARLGRQGRSAGISALKPLRNQPGAVELKRVYVRPEARGYGVGRALLTAAVDLARSLSATRIVLETHAGYMPVAVALYRHAGFVDAPALGVTRHPDVLTLSLDLTPAEPALTDRERRAA